MTQRRTADDAHSAVQSATTLAAIPASRTTTNTSTPMPRIGRIPILNVGPVVDGGRWPTKAVVNEPIPVSATVFREGADLIATEAVLITPEGEEHSRVRMSEHTPGTDRYVAWVAADDEGVWGFRVQAWADVYGSWCRTAHIKVEANVDADLILEEGAQILLRALESYDYSLADQQVLNQAISEVRDTSRQELDRLNAATNEAVTDVMARNPLRDHLTVSATLTLQVQRTKALYSTWYEMFPRSEGAHIDENGHWVSGTLRQAAQRLPAIAAMGFDVVYLPPIHPVGRVHRKGRNNTLTPDHDDPGSPWAIGSDEGGHDAIHPDLGTFADFDDFVATARSLGIEVALDLALQCAPDHPWAREHPRWFTARADGSIAYAENPPKKYQDIYPLNFDNNPEGLYAEVLRVVELWISHGVTIFRVDNPHTKPLRFWEWLIHRVNDNHPNIIFLAEAFARPAMLRTLAKIGFHQSYTYFTWRNRKDDLTNYAVELATRSADYLRPNFWPNTPDILSEYLQYSGPAGFKIRAAVASTLSPSWGMYSGYELCEHVALRPGSEEYLDSEKYQYRPRDWDSYAPGGSNEGGSIAPYIAQLNAIRKNHRALQFLRNVWFHGTDNDQVMCYSRRLPADQHPEGVDDTILVIVNLDPHHSQETTVHFNMPQLGMDWNEGFQAYDELTGETFEWQEHTYVKLDPHHQPAHIIHLRRR